MPPISLNFETTDFQGRDIKPDVIKKKLTEKFGKETDRVSRACIAALEEAATTLRNSLNQTCVKVNMDGTATTWVFVRYSHDAKDIPLLSGGGGAAPASAAVPDSPPPAKKPEPAAAAEPPKLTKEESNSNLNSWGAVKKKKPKPVDPISDDDTPKAAPVRSAPAPAPRSPSPPPRKQAPPAPASPPPRQQQRDLSPPPRHYDAPPPRMTPTPQHTPMRNGGGRAATMTVYDVGKWLREVELVKYTDAFEYACIDGRALFQLHSWSVTDMKGFMQFVKEDLGVTKAGHALQLSWALQHKLE